MSVAVALTVKLVRANFAWLVLQIWRNH